MHVTLLRVPTIVDNTASTAPVTPPIGLAYLKSVVNHYTDNISIIDSVGNCPQIRSIKQGDHDCKLLGQTKDQIVNILDKETDIILVSIMFTQDWLYTKEILTFCRKKCKNAIIICGGEHITAMPEYSLETTPEIDICVSGEGEAILNLLLKEFKENGSINCSQLDSDSIHTRFSKTKSNDVTRINDVNNIEWPDWDGFPLINYWEGNHSFGVALGNKTMPILASRGCPYRCTFCSSPQMWTTRWQARDPKDLVKEMKIYINKYEVTNFDFYDLTAIVKKEWIIDFCNLLLKENLKITWQLPSGTRSEAIDKDVAILLKESGCCNMSYAPESGSEEILIAIKKKVKLGRMLSSMKTYVSQNMSIKANIMCGFPTEKWTHLFESLSFITKVAFTGIDDLSINQFSPYPGSELYNEMIKDGSIILNDEYFISLSYYSSMTNSKSYSKYLSNKELIFYKYMGTILFYLITFLTHPKRIFSVIANVYKRNETNRLEKTLISFLNRA